MTTAERLEARGEARGRAIGEAIGEARGEARGMAIGRQLGWASTLLQVITLKFGAPDDAVRARIEGAELETLMGWTAHVLTAETLEELLR